MGREHLTLNEAAEIAGVKPASLRVAIWRKRLSATREDSGRGPLWYVTQSDLDAYIEQRGRPHRRAEAGNEQ